MTPELTPLLNGFIVLGIAIFTVGAALGGLIITISIQSEKRTASRIDRLETELKQELAQMRAETNQRFARQEDQTKQQFQRMEDQTKQQFAALEARTNQRFEQTDQRFNQIDLRFNQIDQRFNQTDQRFDQLQAETRRQFSELEARANQRFDQLQAETKRQFERVEDHLHSLAGGQGHLAGEISMLKDLFTHLFPGNNPA